VENINKLASKDNNAPQFIKTILFNSKFALVLEEDTQLKIICKYVTASYTKLAKTKIVLRLRKRQNK
jgi:hypothetical protein